MIRRVGFAAFIAAALLLPAVANAVTQQGIQTLRRWGLSDKCAQQAQRQFPDYTAEAQAKRNLALQQCLANQNLPPRELPTPQQP
jgi:muramoyltetrapeptide carboxypeptidase LdcA involved in peptidoglycan recycling